MMSQTSQTTESRDCGVLDLPLLLAWVAIGFLREMAAFSQQIEVSLARQRAVHKVKELALRQLRVPSHLPEQSIMNFLLPVAYLGANTRIPAVGEKAKEGVIASAGGETFLLQTILHIPRFAWHQE
jgi:hypothetical protein